MENNFNHSGDLGDIIYSLPTIKAMGGGNLFLTQTEESREKMNKLLYLNIFPLIKKQRYINQVELYENQKINYNLDFFRKLINKTGGYHNLADYHARTFGLKKNISQEKWLFVQSNKITPIVINRSLRCHTLSFPWREIICQNQKLITFIGYKEEYDIFCKSFGKVNYFPTKNLLEVAEIIEGADLFIGNQSCCYAIAEGLKKTSIIESIPSCNVIFKRNNVTYSHQGNVSLPLLL